jgi:hypothetical protein
MHVFGAVEFPSEVHVVGPVNFLNEYHRDLGFACRGDQSARNASSLLGEVHVGYAVFRAGHVRSAALEVHHDERRFAHDQGPLGIFLLSHTNLVVLKAGRLPARETIRRGGGDHSYARRQVRLCRLEYSNRTHPDYGAMLWMMDA